MKMNSIFALGLLSGMWVSAQLATGSRSSTSTLAGSENASPTIASLPSITPFQIPPGVLQGLGLPLVIPAMEPDARQPAAKGSSGRQPGPRPANNPPWSAPPATWSDPGRQDYRYGTQGGLPYDRYAPVITANISSITGAGHYTIYQCYNSYISWRNASTGWAKGAGRTVATTTIPTRVIVTTFTNTNVPTVTRCDNVVIVPSAGITPISLTFSDPWTSLVTAFPTSAPSCTLWDRQCEQAFEAYRTKTYSVISSVYAAHFARMSTRLPGSIQFDNIEPPCRQPLAMCPPSEEVAECKVEARGATVYYWPSSVSGDFCGNGATIGARPTARNESNTAVFEGVTITSPSPLLVIVDATRNVMPPATMVAEESDIYYRPCGYSKDLRFPVDPQNVSSVRIIPTPTKTVRRNYTFSTEYGSTTKPFPFNFAHLDDVNLPWEAFLAAGDCPLRQEGLCNNQNKSFTVGQYRAELNLGNASIPSLDSAMAGCAIPSFGTNVKFVPITAATVTVPSITHWGATVSVGPTTQRLEPSPVWRPYEAQETSWTYLPSFLTPDRRPVQWDVSGSESLLLPTPHIALPPNAVPPEPKMTAKGEYVSDSLIESVSDNDAMTESQKSNMREPDKVSMVRNETMVIR